MVKMMITNEMVNARKGNVLIHNDIIEKNDDGSFANVDFDFDFDFESLCQKARRNLKSEQAAKLLREIENYIDQKEYERAEITVELQILGSLRARLSDKAHE
jgi:hypothetical protein